MWYGKIHLYVVLQIHSHFVVFFSVDNVLNFIVYNNSHSISHKLSFYIHFLKSDDAALSYIAHILQIEQITQITEHLVFTLIRIRVF